MHSPRVKRMLEHLENFREVWGQHKRGLIFLVRWHGTSGFIHSTSKNSRTRKKSLNIFFVKRPGECLAQKGLIFFPHSVETICTYIRTVDNTTCLNFLKSKWNHSSLKTEFSTLSASLKSDFRYPNRQLKDRKLRRSPKDIFQISAFQQISRRDRRAEFQKVSLGVVRTIDQLLIATHVFAYQRKENTRTIFQSSHRSSVSLFRPASRVEVWI